MSGLRALLALRPDALDRQISAISAHDLLNRSAFDLVDPVRAAAAAHLEETQLLLLAAMMALQIGVLAWFWRSGRSAALRDALIGRLRSTFFQRFVFGALLTVLDKGVAFVPQAAEYRFLRIMGLSEQLFRTWLAEWIAGTLVAMIVAGLLAAIVLWLADRTHQWYLYTLAAILGGTLLTSFVAPAASVPALAAAPLRPVEREAVSALRTQTGVNAPIVLVRVSQRTRTGTSFVLGLGSSERIVISDTLLAAQTVGETRFLIARGMAWIAANVPLQLALVQAGFLILGVALAVGISDRIGFRRDDDPVSRLALLGAIMGVVYLIAAPFYNTYTRNLQISAEDRAVSLTGDRASAVRYYVRHADEALVPLCPHALAQWYLTGHPAPGPRIAALQGVADACPRRSP